jgi:chemotaxis protein MotA
VFVFGAVVAGYMMEHGNLRVLMQPAEMIIIVGAAVGTVLVANPLHILKKIVGGLGGVLGGSEHTKQASPVFSKGPPPDFDESNNFTILGTAQAV